MINIKLNNINSRFYPSTLGFRNKTLVLLNGLPGKPKDYEVISKFNSFGFDVFLLEYEGTWNSSGKFLITHPALAIDGFMQSIVKGINISEKQQYKTEHIYVIGSGFGGWVGLSLSDSDYIKKVCLLSPVITFKRVKNIDTLGDYLKTNFPIEYRFEFSDWLLLVNDKLIKNNDISTLKPEKVMIISGSIDDQIDINEIIEFSKIRNLKLLIENTGHITLSRISEEILIKIMSFFD